MTTTSTRECRRRSRNLLSGYGPPRYLTEAGMVERKRHENLLARPHQLDGTIELADSCKCVTHFSEGIPGWPDFREMRVERSRDCPIDEHRMTAQQALTEDAA